VREQRQNRLPNTGYKRKRIATNAPPNAVTVPVPDSVHLCPGDHDECRNIATRLHPCDGFENMRPSTRSLANTANDCGRPRSRADLLEQKDHHFITACKVLSMASTGVPNTSKSGEG
jgi:hypothetical protein